MAVQIPMISQTFRNFVFQCDAVLSQLHSALTVESADTATSNTSLMGWIISNQSYQKNHQAANAIDSLSMEAARINQMIVSMGLLSIPPLDTTINGNAIRIAENDEHHFFIDWFTDGAYSSLASMNTAGRLQEAIFRVNNVRNQAQSVLFSLPLVAQSPVTPTCHPVAPSPVVMPTCHPVMPSPVVMQGCPAA